MIRGLIKRFLQAIPVFWKQVWLFVLSASFSAGAIFWAYHQVSVLIYPKTNIEMLLNWQIIFLELFLMLITVWLFAFLIIYFDSISFLRQINLALKNALLDRKLEADFDNYYTGKTFKSVIYNLYSVFALLKSFDAMKARRISGETNAQKTVMDNVYEGIIFVNKEQVVTHINPAAEEMLRLMPGEILEHAINRKINLPDLLENLDLALEKDKKVMDADLLLKNKPYKYHIVPVKNKQGELFRAVIILIRTVVPPAVTAGTK